jgi:hypothetical protein
MAKFHPAEDGYLIVQLPNEKLRAVIRRVVTDDAVIVEITSLPLTRLHNYQRGDYVACRRKDTALGEIWEAVSEQKISIEQMAEKEMSSREVEKPKKLKKKDKKKKVKK